MTKFGSQLFRQFADTDILKLCRPGSSQSLFDRISTYAEFDSGKKSIGNLTHGGAFIVFIDGLGSFGEPIDLLLCKIRRVMQVKLESLVLHRFAAPSSDYNSGRPANVWDTPEAWIFTGYR